MPTLTSDADVVLFGYYEQVKAAWERFAATKLRPTPGLIERATDRLAADLAHAAKQVSDDVVVLFDQKTRHCLAQLDSEASTLWAEMNIAMNFGLGNVERAHYWLKNANSLHSHELLAGALDASILNRAILITKHRGRTAAEELIDLASNEIAKQLILTALDFSEITRTFKAAEINVQQARDDLAELSCPRINFTIDYALDGFAVREMIRTAKRLGVDIAETKLHLAENFKVQVMTRQILEGMRPLFESNDHASRSQFQDHSTSLFGFGNTGTQTRTRPNAVLTYERFMRKASPEALKMVQTSSEQTILGVIETVIDMRQTAEAEGRELSDRLIHARFFELASQTDSSKEATERFQILQAFTLGQSSEPRTGRSLAFDI